MFNNLTNTVCGYGNQVAGYAKPLAIATAGFASEVITDYLLSDPTTTKVYVGTVGVITGAMGLAKSNIIDNTVAYFTGKEVKPVRYGLAAISTLCITSSAYIAFTGLSELFYRNSNNMCRTHYGFCHDNLDIPREQMPQVEGEAANKFLSFFDEKGVKVLHTQLPANRLMATQNELNQEKVIGMVSAAKAGKFNPCKMEIIASSDGHVLDGHHRWATCAKLKMPINVAMIDVPIQKLLDFANSFEGVTHQGLNHFSNPAATAVF